MSENNQQLHTEEVHDIITAPPSWIMRWGISVFFAVLVMVTGLSYFIRYPDLVTTHTVIYSNSSSQARANVTGLLTRILVANNQSVNKGQPLAFIGAGGDHRDILALIDSLQNLKNSVQKQAGNPQLAEIRALDKLQKHYQEALSQFNSISGSGTSREAFLTRAEGMLIPLNKWKEQYVICTPQSGNVSIAGMLQDGYQVKAGQTLFYITSNDHTGFYGSMTISQHDITKVKKGQQVLIKLSAYSFEDYGLVRGTIDSISKLPLNDSVFVSRVKLDTAINPKIALKNGLSATSQVVTADLSLMGRIIGNVKRNISVYN